MMRDWLMSMFGVVAAPSFPVDNLRDYRWAVMRGADWLRQQYFNDEHPLVYVDQLLAMAAAYYLKHEDALSMTSFDVSKLPAPADRPEDDLVKALEDCYAQRLLLPVPSNKAVVLTQRGDQFIRDTLRLLGPLGEADRAREERHTAELRRARVYAAASAIALVLSLFVNAYFLSR